MFSTFKKLKCKLKCLNWIVVDHIHLNREGGGEGSVSEHDTIIVEIISSVLRKF